MSRVPDGPRLEGPVQVDGHALPSVVVPLDRRPESLRVLGEDVDIGVGPPSAGGEGEVVPKVRVGPLGRGPVMVTVPGARLLL